MSKDDSRPLTRDLAPFGVRLPPDLKSRIHAAAEANNRSMNAEIVATLEKTYPPPTDPAAERFAAAFEMIDNIRKAATDEAAERIMHQLNVALAIARSPIRVTFGSPMRDASGKRNVITVNPNEPDDPPW